MKKKILTFLILFLTIQLGWTQTKTISSNLKEKVKKASLNIKTNETNPMDPLSLNATVVWSDDKSQLAIVMKANLEDEWHIYAYVPKHNLTLLQNYN